MKITIILLIFFICIIGLTSLVMFLNMPNEEMKQDFSQSGIDIEKGNQDIRKPVLESLKRKVKGDSESKNENTLETDKGKLNKVKKVQNKDINGLNKLEADDEGKIRNIEAVNKKQKKIIGKKIMNKPNMINSTKEVESEKK